MVEGNDNVVSPDFVAKRKKGRPYRTGVYDPWEPETTGYDRNKIYTRSTNDKGFSDPIAIKMPPEVIGAIRQWMDDNNIPGLKSTGDFVRNAAIHALEYYREGYIVREEDINAVRTEEQLCDIERAEANEAKLEYTMKATLDYLEQLLNKDYGDRFIMRMSQAWDFSEGLSHPERGQFEDKLKTLQIRFHAQNGGKA